MFAKRYYGNTKWGPVRIKPREWIPILMSVGWLSICTGAAASGDFVYGPEFTLSGPVAEDIRWTASLEPQITSDAQQAGEISLVGGLCWKPMAHVTVAPQFKYVTKGTDPNSNESRPRIALELDGKAGPLTIAIRNRFEYRMKEDEDEYWRYRARVKVKFPKVGTVTPFLYEEVFYEFGDKDELSGNEAGCGGGLPIGDKLGLEIDLRCCNSRSEGNWGTGNIHLLTVLKYAF